MALALVLLVLVIACGEAVLFYVERLVARSRQERAYWAQVASRPVLYDWEADGDA